MSNFKLSTFSYILQKRVCKCRQNRKGCNSELLVGKHTRLFNKFRELTYDCQSQFLCQVISLQKPQRRRVQEEISRRHCTVKYTLDEVQICKAALCYIFSITQRRVQYLINKLKYNADVYDQRGKHTNRPRKVAVSDYEKVCEHIKSFPHQENHYSRNNSSKKCLAAELNISKMHRLFLKKYPGSKISLRTYHDIFKSKFNLRFGLPRSDTCSYCDKLFIKLSSTDDANERRSVEIESKIHHMRAEAGYNTLKQDTEIAKINLNYIVLCTDLQQVLFCPTLTHSSIFYQRQFSTYNYAVHNMGEGKATMLLWHEAMANRGSTEIASALLLYITENFEPIEPGIDRKLVVWSDRCVGQNNNWKMITLLRLLLLEKYFTQVEQKFLTSGHSFLPCDRDFAIIERQKKTSSVYEPSQWADVIAKSKVRNPFKVIFMHQSFFKDFSSAEKGVWRDPNCKITQSLWIQITSDEINAIRMRKSHNIIQPWSSYSLKKRKTAPDVSLSSVEEAYKEPLPVKKEKLKNLLDMCDYIPLKYISFYESLKSE